MKPLHPILVAAALGALGGCGDRHDEAGAAPGNQTASAEGKAEEGKISIKGPGVDVTFVVPKAMRGEAKADKDSKFFYPGATIGGIAIVGGQREGKKEGESEAEFRFATADPPERVAAWYRDPARAKDIRVTSATKAGSDIVIAGTQPADGHPFKVRLTPRAGGGTDGRLAIHHND